jgi:hypothetical protein
MTTSLLTLELDETGEARIAEQELPGAFAIVSGRYQAVAGTPVGDRSVLVQPRGETVVGQVPPVAKPADGRPRHWWAFIAKGSEHGGREGEASLVTAGMRQAKGYHLPTKAAARHLGELLGR